jgi:hypothetical protein
MVATESAAFGVFANRSNAEAAVGHLTLAGFSNQDISALLSDKLESQEFATGNQTKAAGGAILSAGHSACSRELAPWRSLGQVRSLLPGR